MGEGVGVAERNRDGWATCAGGGEGTLGVAARGGGPTASFTGSSNKKPRAAAGATTASASACELMYSSFCLPPLRQHYAPCTLALPALYSPLLPLPPPIPLERSQAAKIVLCVTVDSTALASSLNCGRQDGEPAHERSWERMHTCCGGTSSSPSESLSSCPAAGGTTAGASDGRGGSHGISQCSCWSRTAALDNNFDRFALRLSLPLPSSPHHHRPRPRPQQSQSQQHGTADQHHVGQTDREGAQGSQGGRPPSWLLVSPPRSLDGP